tara:strand:- start:4776 stop:5213 length:438 start_codon:yes stop_codon:yes gene_type:complete
MKFKITNKAVEWLKVEYEDGSWAQIPSVGGLNKTDWHHIINSYAPKPRCEKLEDIPWNIGDEDDTEVNLQPATLYSYEAARVYLFPTDIQIMLAEYEARKGNDAPITAIDKRIEDILTEVPVDKYRVYTQEEVDALFKKINEEPV